MEDRPDQTSAEYWKDHVVSWEASAYFKESETNPSFWDRVSTRFRGEGMYVRMDAALRMLKPHLQGRTILDIGCASGRFVFQLVDAGAQQVIGVDVSPDAIAAADRHRQESCYSDRLEFTVLDIADPDAKFPEADIATSLGVIEYFDAATLDSILGRLRSPSFFFEFPDDQGRKSDWLTWQLRRIYLRLNRCPGVYLYSRAEFDALAAKHGFRGLRYERHDTFYYVTNLAAS